ncbi:porin [Phormidium tenue FACHB-886]|nr:porin [Phormidium tenue FACHB-886]
MCPQATHPERLEPSNIIRLSHLLLVGAISTLIGIGLDSNPAQATQTSPSATDENTAAIPEFSLTVQPDLTAAGDTAADASATEITETDVTPVDASVTNATDTALVEIGAADSTFLPSLQPAEVSSDPENLYTPTAIADQTLPTSEVTLESTAQPAAEPAAQPPAQSAAQPPAQSAAEFTSNPPAETLNAQTSSQAPPSSSDSRIEADSQVLGTPIVRAQAAYILQDGDSSARLRLTGAYPVTPNLLFGATLDLVTGDDFTDSEDVGFDVNELYVTLSPEGLSNVRLTVGMVDLTSYFDRNSFAKDSVTHFFNPVFQTNPALAATGIGSRPTLLLNWDITDDLNVRAAGFSSSRDLGNLDLDGFAGEVALRLGTLIVRGTYATDRDAGQDDGFREIFQFNRGDNRFGLRSGDREEAFGINAELFIPELNLGLFGRYGHYQNLELDRGGDTYSFGLNLLDVFMADDRLGLAYGRQLSNSNLRGDDKIPDVLEAFYDVRLTPNLRAGVSFQERNGFSDTVLGLRIRADFNVR